MKFWYYSSLIQSIINDSPTEKSSFPLIIKEIECILGEELSKKVEQNVKYAELIKYMCPKAPTFSLYKLTVLNERIIFFENETSCSCKELNKITYHCQHIIIFLLLKHYSLYTETEISFEELNKLLADKRKSFL